MNKTFLKTAIGVVLTASLFSCSNEIEDLNTPSVDVSSTSTKQEIMTEFAKALSSVVSENQDARELIKTEAIKQFDNNYDILWDEIKDKSIGSCTLREAIAQKTSNEFITQAEEKLPLLNIFFPKITMFGVSPEKYSSSDNELPVVATTPETNLMYYAGEQIKEIKKGDVPAFNVLVVNENKLVEVDETITRGGKRTYKLKYDNDTQSEKTTRGEGGDRTIDFFMGDLSKKVIEAYNYYYEPNNDKSIHSINYQRDYIYYGLTPQKTTARIDSTYGEFISFIEVDPRAYNKIADQGNGSGITGHTDPMFDTENGKTHKVVSRKKADFTKEELINEIWTAGSFEFRFEILKSTESKSIVKVISVRPDDIWDFHEEDHKEYEAAWLFGHSKYTYTIDLQYFTAKKYILPKKDWIFLDTWNPKKESLYRIVNVYEEDDETEEEFSITQEFSMMKSSKFSGNNKVGIGLEQNGDVKTNQTTEISNGSEVTDQNTTKTTKTIKVKRNQKDDKLGTAKMYFYEPIIWTGTQIPFIGTSTFYAYNAQTYLCGYLKFGITVCEKRPYVSTK